MSFSIEGLTSFHLVDYLFQDNAASSSGTNLRASLIGMGFSPSLIDKVIKEKGRLCLGTL